MIYGVSVVPVPFGVEHVLRSVSSSCSIRGRTYARVSVVPVPFGVEHASRSVSSSCSIRGRTCATECQ